MRRSRKAQPDRSGGEAFAIRGARVLTAARADFDPGCVVVEHGRIVYAGPVDGTPGGLATLDASGLVLTPGLIDAHSHIGLMGEPETPATQDFNETSRAVTPELRAADAFNPFDEALHRVLRGGVTAAYTQPGSANVIGGLGVVVKTWAPRPDRMVIPETGHMSISLGENPKEFHGARQGRAPVTRMGEVSLVREALAQAAAWAGDLNSAPLPVQALMRVLHKEIKARFHCLRADDILNGIRIGEEFDLDYTLEGVLEGWKVAEVIAEHGIPCVYGPLVGPRRKFETLQATLRTPHILGEAGVVVAFQSAGASEAEFLAPLVGLAVREGLSPRQALRGLTINAAMILGLSDRLGSLEVGKDADLALFDGDPLSSLSRCVATWVDGHLAHVREGFNLRWL